jgi:hypothetical protein
MDCWRQTTLTLHVSQWTLLTRRARAESGSPESFLRFAPSPTFFGLSSPPPTAVPCGSGRGGGGDGEALGQRGNHLTTLSPTPKTLNPSS